MNAREYYLSVQDAVHAAPHVLRSDMRFEEIDAHECYPIIISARDMSKRERKAYGRK